MEKQWTILELDALIPYENNPRKNDNAVEAVAESIKQVGYITPIVVDEDLVVLAGHTRLKGLKTLGEKEAEVLMVKGLSEEQKRKYRILDNKVGEFSEWDFEALEQELASLDFEGFDFSFDDQDEEKENSDKFFRDKGAYTEDREETEEYKEFLDKFENKHTTDDCYTPDNIYDCVADWVADQYGVKRDNFVRPFYPGGDYQKYKYKDTDIVVDNPPFSIESEIIQFYKANNIKFFLFAPALTLLSGVQNTGCTCICTNAGITYENGANVNTSFITTLGNQNIQAMSCPDLLKKIDDANEENLRKIRKHVPAYKYPDCIVTAAMIGKYSKYGVDYQVLRSESVRIRELDAMNEKNKAIYGGGFLLSEKAAAEKAAAEKAAAEVWELSEREKEIQRNIGK